MRSIGLDLGRHAGEAAIVDETGQLRSLRRIEVSDAGLAAFARTLRADDAVVLEASSNTWAIAERLAPHVGRVVVSNPLRTRAIAAAKTKTDKIDARTLASLLAAGYLPEVWQPDPATQALRRLVSLRASLVRRRTVCATGSRRSSAGGSSSARRAIRLRSGVGPGWPSSSCPRSDGRQDPPPRAPGR